RKCGLDGVVCSAQEATALRKRFGDDFCLVTPGIRLDDKINDDQRRTLTPVAAIAAGSSYLVIGRPITQAQDPVLTCREIFQALQSFIRRLSQTTRKRTSGTSTSATVISINGPSGAGQGTLRYLRAKQLGFDLLHRRPPYRLVARAV